MHYPVSAIPSLHLALTGLFAVTVRSQTSNIWVSHKLKTKRIVRGFAMQKAQSPLFESKKWAETTYQTGHYQSEQEILQCCGPVVNGRLSTAPESIPQNRYRSVTGLKAGRLNPWSTIGHRITNSLAAHSAWLGTLGHLHLARVCYLLGIGNGCPQECRSAYWRIKLVRLWIPTVDWTECCKIMPQERAHTNWQVFYK